LVAGQGMQPRQYTRAKSMAINNRIRSMRISSVLSALDPFRLRDSSEIEE
jgi:hypothetical protein